MPSRTAVGGVAIELWCPMVAARAARRGLFQCPRRRARHASTADHAHEREERGTHDGSWSHTTGHTRLSSSRESLGAQSSLFCSSPHASRLVRCTAAAATTSSYVQPERRLHAACTRQGQIEPPPAIEHARSSFWALRTSVRTRAHKLKLFGVCGVMRARGSTRSLVQTASSGTRCE